jgi:alcohol dehydrogenase (nicotinoprotein)
MRTKAAIIREPGKPWEITELELDEPGQGEVRIIRGVIHHAD